jgi:class 3 adenylate cyclase
MISGSRSVNLPGADYHWLGEDVDSLLTEITQFITGESRLPTPERLLCAVMFTDIVGSTERASAMGDAHWKALLDRHDNVIDHEVHRRSGRVVKSTGDGVLVTFPSAENALRAASALRSRLEEEGLGVRIGIHIGDVERHGDDLAGLGVHVAARVVALAKPGEILVTASVPLATLGAGHSFEPRGSHTLRGTPGDWDLYCWS